MLKWLFSKSTSSYQTKQRSIFLGLAFGIFGLFPAIITVITAGSLTVFSDLLRNVALVFAMFFSWITIRRVARGMTPLYNYGYGKMENLSSLDVAAVLLVSMTIIIYQAIERFQNPVPLRTVGVWTGIIFAALAAFANGWLWWQSHRAGSKEPSPVMQSVTRLNQVKTVSTLCVLLSLSLSFVFRDYSWAVYIDPAGSIVMLGFLVFTTYAVVSSSVFDLLDRTLEDSLQLLILRELALRFDSYSALHGIRSRRAGGNVYIEVFLEFEYDQKVGEVQDVIDGMKREMEKKIPGSQVIIVPTSGKALAETGTKMEGSTVQSA